MEIQLHESAVLGADAVVAQSGKTVLIHGATQVGKRTLALDIARRLNCNGCTDQSCRGCRMALAGTHPNILLVEPDDKGKIGVEAVHGLQHNLRYEQYDPTGQRVVVIVGADSLTLPAQSALLKTLEEPPAGTTILLTAVNPSALLPTVLSRCSRLFLPLLSEETITSYLTSRLGMPSQRAVEIANMSDGALGRAITYLRDEAALEADRELLGQIAALAKAQTLFERLRVAGNIATETGSRESYLRALRRFAGQQARNGSTHWLEAVERLQERLQANVSPKAAYEALAVELSW